MCGPSMSSSTSSTSATRRSLMSSTAPIKSRQKSFSTCCQEISLLEMRSSCSSIAAEEVFQERDHDAALVLAMQALLLELHIAAVLQDLQDRGIGRGTADAQF